ncbi:MAG: putative endonuclease [Lysobacterales bacterium]|jgi:putative endonuclease
MNPTEANQWFVYIIEADDNSWYTGITTDVQRRFKEHVSGVKGARYFRGRKPSIIVFTEGGHNRKSASQREAKIKKMSRAQKQSMVASLL